MKRFPRFKIVATCVHSFVEVFNFRTDSSRERSDDDEEPLIINNSSLYTIALPRYRGSGNDGPLVHESDLMLYISVEFNPTPPITYIFPPNNAQLEKVLMKLNHRLDFTSHIYIV